MNLSDLMIVVAVVTGLYGVLVALMRQRSFLLRAVNPHRWQWFLAGTTCLWGGIGLLRLEAGSWAPDAIGTTLAALVTDAPLSSRGKMASVSVLLGLLFLVLVFWCIFNFPRDPGTFNKPTHRRKALNYYVATLKGGLDYAVLMRADGQRVEESKFDKHLRHMLPHMPLVPSPSGERIARTVNDQVNFWREAAANLHQSMTLLNDVMAPAHQGGNRRFVFDTEYGGMFFAYLRVPVPGQPDGEAMYLFGATLNQAAMTSKQADLHFDMLYKALKQIETSVRFG
jgi:hypothetical protein